MGKVLLLCIVLMHAFFLPPIAFAEKHFASDRTYTWLPYFVDPCSNYNVPIALALAIARQESGTRPWVINVAGKSYFPESRSEAYAIADQAYNAGQSFDVGIMQINSYWLKKYRIAIEEVLEPQKNIAMGVWILAREIQRYGLTWQAIGAYHTPLARNPDRARAYASSVISLMRSICDHDKALRVQANALP